MRFGLKEEVIQKIQKVVAAFPEVEEVVLYGSRAKGNYKNGSDIDISLKGTSIKTASLNKIILAIDELSLPYTFDIAIYHQIDNKDLLDHIDRVGQILYKKT